MTAGLVHVSVGLGDVGGVGHAGRLIAHALAEFASQRGMPFEVLSLGERGERQFPFPVTFFSQRRASFAWAVANRQLLGRPRLLFFDHLGPSRIQTLIPSFRCAPYVVLVHGIEVWAPLGGQRARALSGAVRILTNSQTTARAAASFLPPGTSAIPVHLALEPFAETGAPDPALLARAGTGFVLTVGRIDRDRKGHDELLAALPVLRATIPGARLVIAGGGSDQPRLEALARVLGVADAVLFTGQVSDATLTALYERCGVFAMPSRVEGFGLVFLEAMRAGKPCVALECTAPAEIVVHGETGLLAADTQPATLASALARLLADPSESARFGEAGRRRYREQFTTEAFAARLHPHLDALLA